MEQKKIHLTYGFITGLAIIIIGMVLHVAGLSDKGWALYVQLLPFLVGILLNATAFSKALDHEVTFGKVFSSCFRATAIITLLMILWTVLSMMIFPEIKERAIEKAIEGMAEKGLSDDQIEQSINITRKFFTPFAMGGALFMYMFFGAIFSLLGAAIAKKNPPQRNTIQP